MSASEPRRITTISEFHRLVGLPRPEHPLISVIRLEQMQPFSERLPAGQVFDFYTISLKHHAVGNFRYGQQQYDGEGGVMYFMAPGQVFGPVGTGEEALRMAGWGLYIHPDFLWNMPLARGIKKYDYFAYSVHEALHLSEKEEATVGGLMQTIQTEYSANPDKFSQEILLSLVEVLLNYADRFYHRQFLTRKMENHQLLNRLEALLSNYFEEADLVTRGLPSVPFIAEKLAISPNYLSSLLKVLTGRTTQQHIQDKLLEQAKQQIASTHLSVSEIAYALGFEHPQSFSRLFKAKTGLSPLAFRQSVN